MHWSIQPGVSGTSCSVAEQTHTLASKATKQAVTTTHVGPENDRCIGRFKGEGVKPTNDLVDSGGRGVKSTNDLVEPGVGVG